MQILSVDGGGYLGLATAAFIEGLEHHFGAKTSDRFELFCGTSTGAIIALGLALGKSGAELRELYVRLGRSVLRPRWGFSSRPARILFPKYATAPLRKALADAFGEATLDDLHARGKRIVVTSFCLSNGLPRIFKTNHSPKLTLHGGYRIVDVALASAAAPVYFPCVRIDHPVHGIAETFCDGGVVTNHPALVAYVEAISECGISPQNVRLLSLSTPRADLALQEPVNVNRGLWGWGEGLAQTFIEGGARISDELLKRIVTSYPVGSRPLYERVELTNTHRLAFDDARSRATQALLLEGSSRSASNEVRGRLSVFFR